MVKRNRKRELAEKLNEEEENRKKSQLKARLIKIRLAAVGISLPDPEERRDNINKSKNTKNFEDMATTAPREQNQRRVIQEADNINTNKKIKPVGVDTKMTLRLKKKFAKAFKDKSLKQMGDDLDKDFIKFIEKDQNKAIKKKLAKIKQANIDHEHGHTIIFKGHPRGLYRAASLESQQGHYVKYWLLNAKQTNGNGWGIAAHSAKTNMHKFIGRPLVVTSAKWRGSKIQDKYGDTFDHPYIPTNDLNKIFSHQEQYRVGNIVDIGEKNGDYYAMIEMLPKFANMTLPPFCSPAIYQLDAREAEGQISKWEALHLAALDTDPAYGARIAILKGTCVGSNNECRIQFKTAKQHKPSAFSQERQNQQWDAEREQSFTHSLELNQEKHNAELRRIKASSLKRRLARVTKGNTTFDSKKGSNIVDVEDIEENIKPIKGTGGKTKKEKRKSADRYFAGKFVGRKGESKIKTLKRKAGELFSGDVIFTEKEKKIKEASIVCTKSVKSKLSKLKKKLRLATLGEENMTFQKSKKIKIHKRKHPEVRKAKQSVEDILRKGGSSVDGSHGQSSFLSTKGDFIGGGGTHERQINKILGTENNLVAENEDNAIAFSAGHGLPRVQNFPINKAGERVLSFGIHSKINSTQLKSITDSEIGGRTVGFAVGKPGSQLTTGRGSRDLSKALREHKLI